VCPKYTSAECDGTSITFAKIENNSSNVWTIFVKHVIFKNYNDKDLNISRSMFRVLVNMLGILIVK
jgi:hypothetical protein